MVIQQCMTTNILTALEKASNTRIFLKTLPRSSLKSNYLNNLYVINDDYY